MQTVLAFAFVLAASSARAHGEAASFLTAGTWTYDPWVVAPLYSCGGLYLIGTARLWRRAGHGHGISRLQVGCFWAGWLALALALISPLHWLGERLFLAHMIEHGVLIGIAAPLIVVARPTAAVL